MFKIKYILAYICSYLCFSLMIGISNIGNIDEKIYIILFSCSAYLVLLFVVAVVLDKLGFDVL